MKVSLNKLFYDICYFSFKPIVYSFVAAIGMFTVYKLKDRKGLKYFKTSVNIPENCEVIDQTNDLTIHSKVKKPLKVSSTVQTHSDNNLAEICKDSNEVTEDKLVDDTIHSPRKNSIPLECPFKFKQETMQDDSDYSTLTESCPVEHRDTKLIDTIEQLLIEQNESTKPVSVEEVALRLLRNSNSLHDDSQVFSVEEKETEVECRTNQLDTIFKMLEENDTSFTSSNETEKAFALEDEMEYRFRVLDADGEYQQMPLDKVFKDQMRLYGL